MIKFVALSTAGFGLLISLLSYMKFGSEFALSSLFGAVVMTANLLGLWFIWKLVFSKKSIALVVSVIIFKYLILGLILWNLNRTHWVSASGVVLGLSSLLFGILSSLAFKKYFVDRQN